MDDRYLRIDVKPSTGDPQGWGRTLLGGLLASARPGGAGVAGGPAGGAGQDGLYVDYVRVYV